MNIDRTAAQAQFAQVVSTAARSTGLNITPAQAALISDDAWSICYDMAADHDEYVQNMQNAAAVIVRGLLKVAG